MLDNASESPVPTLNLAPFLDPNDELSAEAQQRLVAELITRLRTPPYWLVFVTQQNPIDLDMLKRLLELMSQYAQPPGAEPPKISSTKVQVDPQEAARKDHVTRYSRTPDALPLHTDSSNKVVPQNLVAFAMGRPDSQGGGESIMLSVADLIHELPGELVHQLHQPVFPFLTNKLFPILYGTGDELRVRYYRGQITSALGSLRTLPDKLTQALDELDRYLDLSQRSVRFHMHAGEVVMMDNHRVLHGRTAMSSNSTRLMHRFRLLIPALAGEPG